MSPFIRPAAVTHADRLLARAVLLILLAIFTTTFAGLPDNPDAEVEFQTTSSLVRTYSLALGGTPEADFIIASGFDVAPGVGDRARRSYSWFGIGQALVGVPFYVVGTVVAEVFPGVQSRHTETTSYGAQRSEYFQHLFVGLRNPLLSALTAWLLVAAARRLGASRRAAFIAGLTYGLCTFAWPQARSCLSDVQATFFLFLAFAQLLRCRERLTRGAAPRRLDLAGFGLALGVAFLTRVATAPVILVLGVALVIVLVRGRRRVGGVTRLLVDFVVLALPALACVAVFLYVNHLRFGDPFETGYGAAVFSGSFFAYPPLWGVIGLLVAPGKGLLWLAPGVLIGCLWFPYAWRQRERFLPWLLFFVVVAVLAPVAPALSWHGAHTYGPRYILPLLPFLWLAVALGLDFASAGGFAGALAKLTIVVGFLTSLPAVLVDYTTHQDLALQAARIAWPEVPGADDRARDDVRFDRIQWDWRFAAPWAHWRIFRHRMAGLGEEYPVRQLFFLDDDTVMRPTHARERGSRHLGWSDLRQRLGGQAWPVLIVCLGFVVMGLSAAFRGFDPTLR